MKVFLNLLKVRKHTHTYINQIKLNCCIYCQLDNKLLIKVIKEESEFSKGIIEEVISSKVPTNTPRVFHTKTTRIQQFHVVSMSFQYGTHAVYF